MNVSAADPGTEIHKFMGELYPICRSITGNGLRETLRRIGKEISLTVHEVPTGTTVFDWVVPKEWNIHDAYIKNIKGERLVDFNRSNLHVVNYSIPVKKRMPLDELKTHLHSLPDKPDWIPYRTSYYKETWGFCLSHSQLTKLNDELYDVCIDASLKDGALSYGEYVLPGECRDEVLISCHVCHPSLCNDNLSGIGLATFLAKSIGDRPRRYSYRFLFLPVTIGAITWLALNERQTANIKHGLVLTCVGDRGHTTYKKSRKGNAEIDRAAEHVLAHSGSGYNVVEFSPYGYDERQYCSPGFNLSVGCIMRTPNGSYPEYHTSADDLDFVRPSALADSLFKINAILNVLEHNRTYMNQMPQCEPQLGKRGLYRQPGGDENMAILWVLNLSDGAHSLLDIAERAKMPFQWIKVAADSLLAEGLLQEQRAVF